ncbi:DsbA family protein, partial [Dietzia maris]|uniref:DsbA family protein n=1 Tax=Dietzia maris TaxID=37915 RepID=UPI003B435427
LVVLVVALLAAGNDSGSEQARPDDSAGTGVLVREDSPRLSEGGDAVFVEFLDFECEACIALYPTIEDLREQYGDRVTFVVRHMPLHDNSMAAALAAEAA